MTLEQDLNLLLVLSLIVNFIFGLVVFAEYVYPYYREMRVDKIKSNIIKIVMTIPIIIKMLENENIKEKIAKINSKDLKKKGFE